MKKIITLIAVAFIATTMNAQMYAGLSVGYGLGANKAVLGTDVSGTTTTNLYGSFGAGLNIGINPGYMFNDNLGFELGLNYLMGSTQTINKTETYLNEGKSSGIRVAPQLVFKIESGFYSRVGLFIPVSGKTVVTEEDKDYMGGGTLMESTVESKGAFSVGFTGAIGYNYKLSDNLDLFGELQYIALSIKQGTATVTKYDVAGVDQLANMKTAQKEIEFVDEIDGSATFNADEPTKMLRDKAQFSSFGINFGVKFNF